MGNQLAELIRVIDKTTGAEFDLFVGGWMPPVSDDRLFEWGFFVGARDSAAPIFRAPVGRAVREHLARLGIRESPFNSDLDPSAADELCGLLAVLPQCQDPGERHFELQQAIHLAYAIGNPKGKSRAKATSLIRPEIAWRLIEPLCWQWVLESETFKPHMRIDEDRPPGPDNLLAISVLDDLRKHLQARGFPERALDAQRLHIRLYSSSEGASTDRAEKRVD